MPEYVICSPLPGEDKDSWAREEARRKGLDYADEAIHGPTPGGEDVNLDPDGLDMALHRALNVAVSWRPTDRRDAWTRGADGSYMEFSRFYERAAAVVDVLNEHVRWTQEELEERLECAHAAGLLYVAVRWDPEQAGPGRRWSSVLPEAATIEDAFRLAAAERGAVLAARVERDAVTGQFVAKK